jgi:antitoxin component YwqK of YwqJK toxin-antitoxin module
MYFYCPPKKSFVNLKDVLLTTAAEAVVLRQRQAAVVFPVLGRPMIGEVHSLNSQAVQFKPPDTVVPQMVRGVVRPRAIPSRVVTLEASAVKAVQTSLTIYFFVPDKKRFVNLQSLLEEINAKEPKPVKPSDEEMVAAWLQLAEGKVPANFEFMDQERPIDPKKAFLRHGRDSGTFVLSDGKTSVAYQHSWFKGQLHGPVVDYYPNGKMKTQVAFVNGHRHGIERGYYETGELRTEIPMVHGRAHGIAKGFYPNGQLKTVEPNVNGQLLGRVTHWHDNGIKAVEAFQDKNGLVGAWISWDRRGVKEKMETYMNGLLHGAEVLYYPTGQVAKTCQWAFGQKHGWEKSFEADGTVLTAVRWQNGLLQP